MASKQTVDQVRNFAMEISGQSIDMLVVNPSWGSIDFQSARGSLDVLFGLCALIRKFPIEVMPEGQLTAIMSTLDQLRGTIKQILGFTLQSPNPMQVRDSLVGQIASQTETFLTQFQGWVGYLAYQVGDVQKNVQALNDAVTLANEVLTSAREISATQKTELDGIVAAAREASASAGVGVFTADFGEQATKLEGSAKLWLGVTACAALLTIALSVASAFYHMDKDASNAQVFQFMTSKLLALGVLASATVWCGRIYRATMHQAAVSDHRAKALRTFQAFAKATSDDVTRDAVLLETTRSIFAIAPTGYLDSADASADTGSKMLEIVKSATSKG